MSMLYGEGGLRVEYGTGVVNLPLSYGDLGWEDEYTEVQTLRGTKLRFYDGSRARIKAVIMSALGDTASVQALAHLLNSARLSLEAVRVYPRYWGARSRGYLCHVPKDFNPERLGLVSAGQKILLTFEGMERYSGVPVYDQGTANLVLWTIHTGDKMTNHLGQNLEFWV